MAKVDFSIIAQAFLDGGSFWQTREDISNQDWIYVGWKLFGGRLFTFNGQPFWRIIRSYYDIDNSDGVHSWRYLTCFKDTRLVANKNAEELTEKQFEEQFNISKPRLQNVITLALANKEDNISVKKFKNLNTKEYSDFQTLEDLEMEMLKLLFSKKKYRNELEGKLRTLIAENDKECKEIAKGEWKLPKRITTFSLTKFRLLDGARLLSTCFLNDLAPKINEKSWINKVKEKNKEILAWKNEMVKKNLPLCLQFVGKLNQSNFLKIPREDLIQESYFGLMRAVEKFDYKKGYKFSTYAMYWIRHNVERSLVNCGTIIRIPLHLLEKNRKVSSLKRKFLVEKGRFPEQEELLGLLRLPKGTRLELAHPKYKSLVIDTTENDKLTGDKNTIGCDIIADPNSPSPDEDLFEFQQHKEIHEALKILTPRELVVINERFGFIENNDDKQTLKTVGKQFSLSRERIRQIQNQALLKLRRKLEERGLFSENYV